jgi:hypothetical protein
MNGNVWQWCQDRHGEVAEEYAGEPAVDPTGPETGRKRALRGGTWISSPRGCRSAYRGWLEPDGRYDNGGFRVVVLAEAQVEAGGAAAPAGRPVSQEQIVAEIKRLGGTVHGDDPAHGGKVDVVNFNVNNSKGVTDAVMEDLDGLGALTILEVYGRNSVTDAGLAHVREMPLLQFLTLQNARITDAGLEQLKDLKLGLLSLGGNKITDAGLVHIGAIKTLKTLWLGNTEVTDAGLEHLKGLKELYSLGLANTKVTDEGVKKLQEALPDCKITR